MLSKKVYLEGFKKARKATKARLENNRHDLQWKFLIAQSVSYFNDLLGEFQCVGTAYAVRKMSNNFSTKLK
jgi:hypothetical protein